MFLATKFALSSLIAYVIVFASVNSYKLLELLSSKFNTNKPSFGNNPTNFLNANLILSKFLK